MTVRLPVPQKEWVKLASLFLHGNRVLLRMRSRKVKKRYSSIGLHNELSHAGTCLAACGERGDNISIPELAEAIAVRRAISFTLEEGFSKIVVLLIGDTTNKIFGH
jgi:hypothetical protein